MPKNEAQSTILSVYVNNDKVYAFVEFTTIELTSAMCNLDGIKFKGENPLKIRRPNDFKPELLNEAALGPIPNLDILGKSYYF